MNTDQTLNTHYVFHIRSNGKNAAILHPFENGVLSMHEPLIIRGFYGGEPEMKAVHDFREFLYRRIDGELRAWLTEQRFIPRFLLAAAVFVVVYFFIAFAIRDPIPIFDEAAGALIAAAFTWGVLGRRDELSSIAVERRAAGRTVVDAVNFEYSPLLEAMEDIATRYEAHPSLGVAAFIKDIKTHIERTDNPELTLILQKLTTLIKERYGDALIHRLVVRFGEATIETDIPWEALLQWAHSNKIEARLIAFYISIVKV